MTDSQCSEFESNGDILHIKTKHWRSLHRARLVEAAKAGSDTCFLWGQKIIPILEGGVFCLHRQRSGNRRVQVVTASSIHIWRSIKSDRESGTLRYCL